MALARAIERDTGLAKRNVADNKLGGDGTLALAEAVASNATLTSVVMGPCNMAGEAAVALAHALGRLGEVRLSSNDIDLRGTSALVAAVARSTTVTKLDVALGLDLVAVSSTLTSMASMSMALRTRPWTS
mgnify:CR=1 FL=1